MQHHSDVVFDYAELRNGNIILNYSAIAFLITKWRNIITQVNSDSPVPIGSKVRCLRGSQLSSSNFSYAPYELETMYATHYVWSHDFLT